MLVFELSMTNETRYQAARMVSNTIESHFSQHIKSALERGESDLAVAPEKHFIEKIIDAAFWASLRREEGRSPKISLAFVSPDLAGHPLLFEKKIKLHPDVLTKLSPGVEHPGVHLGVWHENNQLYIWGTTLKIPNFCFVLDVSEPGLLVIKHRRMNGFGKFANVAVLIGDQVKIVDEKSALFPDCPAILKSLLGNDTATSGNDSIHFLVQLAVAMRAHKHGGTLLIVSTQSTSWQTSIIHPIKYSIKPTYIGITNMLELEKEERIHTKWQGALKNELDRIAGLTAVDGATIINDQFELLAFGAKISRSQGNARVEKILVNEPIIGGEAISVNPSQNGGTRHLSAAQFVHDQRDALALVASQDGNFTVFSWSKNEQIVQAHRIDTLLL